jgi:hypothetical protein
VEGQSQSQADEQAATDGLFAAAENGLAAELGAPADWASSALIAGIAAACYLGCQRSDNERFAEEEKVLRLRIEPRSAK